MLVIPATLTADIAIEPFGTVYHFDREKDYNENSQYVGITYRHEQFELGVATYINSHDERTKTAFVGYRQPLYKEEVELGIFADIGYKDGYDNNHILFYGGVYAEYENFYTKIAVNDSMVACVVGYNFNTEGLFE